MDLSALLLLLGLVFLVILFILAPLRQHRHVPQMDGGRDLSTLLAERDRVLKEIQELDFDHSLGKVPEDEYSLQRKALLKMGAEMMRQIDGMKQTQSQPVPLEEQAYAAVMENAASRADEVSDDDLELLIAERRASRKERTGGFCPKCGKPFLQSDRFCSCCGQPLGAHE